jgi:hypothetical protein
MGAVQDAANRSNWQREVVFWRALHCGDIGESGNLHQRGDELIFAIIEAA